MVNLLTKPSGKLVPGQMNETQSRHRLCIVKSQATCLQIDKCKNNIECTKYVTVSYKILTNAAISLWPSYAPVS